MTKRNRQSCKNCECFDKKHNDIYDEPICKEADEVIRLRRGQSAPDWCPLKSAKQDDVT